MKSLARAVMLLLATSAPALAQYHEYDLSGGRPSVEVNEEALEMLGAAPRPAPATRPQLQPPKVEAEAVPEPVMPPLPAPLPEEKLAVAAPAEKKRLLKPFFTDPVATASLSHEEERATPPPPKPKAEKPRTPVEAVKAAPPPPIPPAPPAREEEELKDISATETTDEDIPVMPKPEAAPAVPAAADLTLGFSGNESEIIGDLRQKLDAVAGQLAESPDMRLQVRAYASGQDGNTSSARRISLSRALSVRSYLMDKGIRPNRVDVRALGTETERGPVDRVDLIFVR